MRRWENLPNQPTQSVGNNADGLRVPETRHESGDRPMPGEPDLDIALLDIATMVFGREGSATKRRRVPDVVRRHWIQSDPRSRNKDCLQHLGVQPALAADVWLRRDDSGVGGNPGTPQVAIDARLELASVCPLATCVETAGVAPQPGFEPGTLRLTGLFSRGGLTTLPNSRRC